MAYHLSVVEIIYEINQQDMLISPKPHTSEMSIILAKVYADFLLALSKILLLGIGVYLIMHPKHYAILPLTIP